MFDIKEISLKNQEQYLLYWKGKFYPIEQDKSKDWYLELLQDRMDLFSLTTFGRVLSLLTDYKIKLDGNIKIQHLDLKGKLTDLISNINIEIPYFRYNNHFIKNLKLNISGNLNLSKQLSFLYDSNQLNDSKNELAFGLNKTVRN
ncbi:MAG: hypothetical protein KatS3mg129_2107 [Leptospiraceae bacterium]|nr:MAG: hypothetical protein KatS3mg129_2107 [Leptospiraceae bacterium]